MENQKGLTKILVEFVTSLSYEDIPSDVREYTKSLIIDQLGVAMAAMGIPAHRVAERFTGSSFGEGAATVWGSKEKSTLAGAVWINSMLGSALDLDDGHRTAVGHPGASIIPCAIAVAEERKRGGKSLIEAIVAGYEVAIRISMSRRFEELDNVCTGVWSGFGAGMAAAKLMSGTPDSIENTLGLVSLFSPRLPGYLPHGRGMVKEGIPWGAMAGIQAAQLTEAGYKGPMAVFDHFKEYRPDLLIKELGKRFLTQDTYIKQYSCCRWLHPVIEVCHGLREENNITPEEITRIRVKTFSRAMGLPNTVHPAAIEVAQFSIPFCCGATMVNGKQGLYLMESDLLKDPIISEISKKVTLLKDDELETAFPEIIGTKVEIETTRDRFKGELIGPMRGDAGKLFSRDEVIEKYLRFATPVLGTENAKTLCRCIEQLEDTSIQEINSILSTASPGAIA